MRAFVCHNKADAITARLVAIALTGQGADVWFDAWKIRPGDSITGGIEEGLRHADAFVLVWSEHAKDSNWVDSELRAYLRQRVDDDSLRIIPIMLDDTPLPVLVADYRGFRVNGQTDMRAVAEEILGNSLDLEIAGILQARLVDLMKIHAASGDPLPYLVCPMCASSELRKGAALDEARDDVYYLVKCGGCGWSDWSQ